MSTKTSIEWTDVTWNPVRGCSLVSAGCANCYAMKTAHRFSGKGKAYEGLTELGPKGPRWNGNISMVPRTLSEPLRWKQPKRVFVNSMSDLFHEDVPDEFIDRVLGVVMLSPWHTYQVLTKRPERMKQYVSGNVRDRLRKMNLDAGMLPGHIKHMNKFSDWQEIHDPETYGFISHWPLRNLWLGVSVEDQATADDRIPILLQTPAAVRFISAEPLLGPVDLLRWFPVRPLTGLAQYERASGVKSQLDWVIIGGESGPGARPCNLAWIRSLKDQCQAAGVPPFVKQVGSRPYVERDLSGWPAVTRFDEDDELPGYVALLKDKKGGDPAEWAEDLRAREWPR